MGVPIRLEAKSLGLELVPKLPSDGAHLSIGGMYLNQMPFRLIVGGAKEHQVWFSDHRAFGENRGSNAIPYKRQESRRVLGF